MVPEVPARLHTVRKVWVRTPPAFTPPEHHPSLRQLCNQQLSRSDVAMWGWGQEPREAYTAPEVSIRKEEKKNLVTLVADDADLWESIWKRISQLVFLSCK